jgi:hypothetical protein
MEQMNIYKIAFDYIMAVSFIGGGIFAHTKGWSLFA